MRDPFVHIPDPTAVQATPKTTASPARTIPFDYPGLLAVSASPEIPCGLAMTVTEIWVALGTAPYVSAVVVDVLRNGGTVASVTVNPGEFTAETTVKLPFAASDTYALAVADTDGTAGDLGGVLLVVS